MRKSKPVSYTVADESLITWAVEQPGGFSRTVRIALQHLQRAQQAESAATDLVEPVSDRLLSPVADIVTGRVIAAVMAKLKGATVITMEPDKAQDAKTPDVGEDLKLYAL